MSEQSEKAKTEPTVLPWHLLVADDVMALNYPPGDARTNIAKCIARRDPHKSPLFTQRVLVPRLEKQIADLEAQHAETLRLLEAALPCIYFTNNSGKAIPEHIELYDEIRAHLAAMKGTKCQH